MKKYAVFTTSEKSIEYQLLISNKILERESIIKIRDIINDWLYSIYRDITLNDWVVNVDMNNNIYITIKDSCCPYKAEILKDKSNIKVNLFKYKYKYTTKEVD